MKVSRLLLFIVFGLGHCGCASQGPSGVNPNPKLVVVIVVDQMTQGHLTRFTDFYEHGFARFIQRGAVFTDAHQYHAVTVTGPGHATISTGAYPSRNGIVNNSWYDRNQERDVYCTQDENSPLIGYDEQQDRDGRSPHFMLSPALGEWLKSQSPESKVFGVGRKDRSSILMAGRKADGVYWYGSSNGNMISSKYYMDSYPDWVNDFNQSRLVDRYFENGWDRILPAEAYSKLREDAFPPEKDGKDTSFPHSFKDRSDKPDRSYYSSLTGTPFSDDLVLEFAKTLVTEEQLGRDESVDILFVGCDAADGVGHAFGPESHESMDHFIRLDRYLGNFFAFLDQEIGEENYLLVLSSDHGVLPMPEALVRRGIDAGRFSREEIGEQIMGAVNGVAWELGLPEGLVEPAGYQLKIDYAMAAEAGVSGDRLRQALGEALTKTTAIAGVYFREDLMKGEQRDQTFWPLFQNSFHPDTGHDAMLRLKKYHLVSSGHGTSHGSAYEYDTHVPFVFLGPGIKQGTYETKVKTVDIAPTLAEIIGIKPTAEIDGKSLWEMIRD